MAMTGTLNMKEAEKKKQQTFVAIFHSKRICFLFSLFCFEIIVNVNECEWWSSCKFIKYDMKLNGASRAHEHEL